MANWYPIENRLGVTNLQQIDSTNVDNTTVNNRYPVGTIVRGQDTSTSAFGMGEFIYLPGCATTAVGMVVSYNASATFATTVLPSTANLGVPVAVAMAANVTTTNFAWYQIEGLATVLKSATQVLPQAKVYISATAGRLFPTSTSGKQILGAKFANLTTVTSTTSTVVVLISRPTTQGQIT